MHSRLRASLLGLALCIPLALFSAAVPDRAQAHVDLALKLMRKGRLLDAKLELETAKALAPARDDIQELLVSVQQPAAGAPSALSATSMLSRSLAIADETAEEALARRIEAHLARGRSAYRDSELKVAAAAWRDALVLDPQQAEALAGQALLAQEAYHTDVDQPFDQTVGDMYAAGMRELRKDRMVEARRKLEEAKALNPMQAQVLRALGLVAEGATKQQSGRDAESLVLEGQRFTAEGEDAKAVAAYAAALQASPGLRAAQEGLAQVQARSAAKVGAACDKGAAALKGKDWNGAEEAYSLALSLDPGHVEAMEGRAKARAHLDGERGLAAKRRDADRLYNSGVEAWQGGDLALAASRFREALGVAPDDAEAAKALQAVRRKLDERSEKDRQDAAALLAEGRTLEQRGALEDALQRYARACAKDPGLAEAAQAKSSLEKKVKGL